MKYEFISEQCVQTMCAIVLNRVDDIAKYGRLVTDPNEKRCIQRVVAAIEDLKNKKTPIKITAPPDLLQS